eukprot:1248769-Lingulodinium_polyedra.AAC.1
MRSRLSADGVRNCCEEGARASRACCGVSDLLRIFPESAVSSRARTSSHARMRRAYANHCKHVSHNSFEARP